VKYALGDCLSLSRTEIHENKATIDLRLIGARPSTIPASAACTANLGLKTMTVTLRTPLGTRRLRGFCTTGNYCETLKRLPYK